LAVILDGTFLLGTSSFVVKYVLRNLGQSSVFVASVPTDVRRKIYHSSAYCSLSPDGRQVNLILGHSPLPVNRDVEYGVSSYFIKAVGGQTVMGVIDLPVPLQEWNGYSPSRQGEGALVDVRRLVLHVTVIPESRVRWIRPAPGLPEHWSVGGEGATHVLALDLDEPLQVWRRNDDFPRPRLGSTSGTYPG
jgi:hypothetical protein